MKSKFISNIFISLVLMFLLLSAALLAENVTIYDIQFTEDSSGDSPYVDQEVTTTGIVTGVGFSGYDDNFTISTPEGGPWNSVYVYMSGTTVAVGDEVEVTGTVEEYSGFTEISGYTNSVTVDILSSGNAVPDPIIKTIQQLNSEEANESVLIRIENVSVVEGPDDYNQWYVTDGTDTGQIDDGLFSYPNPSVGDVFSSITGIVDYGYEEYGVNPRDASDFSSGDDTTPPTLQSAIATSATSVTVTYSEAIDSASATNVDNYEIDNLTIEDVTMHTNGVAVIIETSEQNPGEEYIVTVNSVVDLADNMIEDDLQITFNGFEAGSGEGDLFFSEYVEGSSHNKALEIFNGTGATVDLTGYQIWRISNGGDWMEGESNAVDLSGALADGDVFIVCNSSASPEILAVSDLIGTTATYYNGNDAVGLAKNGVLIDAIGTDGTDPGDAGWSVAGTESATVNHTLIRKEIITEGTTNWALSAGTNTDDSQWIVMEQDDISNLGFHAAGGEDTYPPIVNSANAHSLTSVEVSFNESLDETSAENVSNYLITGLTVDNAELNGNKVMLTTSEQTAETTYTITISNVEDLVGNTIVAGSTVTFTGYVESDYDSIADIQNDTSSWEGQTVNIHGIVTIGVNSIQTDRTNAYIQDNSGRGINIYDSSVINELQRGNEVEITGTVTQYNNTTEITNPQVTLISENNAEPTAQNFELANANNFSLEGTLLKVTGEIRDVYSGGGGTNLNIEDEAGNSLTVRVWDTTGIDIDEFTVGYFLSAIGVGSEFSDKMQVTVGYEDQLMEATNTPKYVTLDPDHPQPKENVTLFYTPPEMFYNIYLYWKTNEEVDFNVEKMDLVDETVITYSANIPGQKQGTAVYYYLELFETEEESSLVPETAPEFCASYNIGLVDNKAILSVPPKAFDPYSGEKFLIEYAAKKDNKVIIRIYNSEGKLMFTPQNLIVGSSSGLNTYLWDGRDKQRQLLPLGLYICHLEVIDKGSGKMKTATAPIVIGSPLK